MKLVELVELPNKQKETCREEAQSLLDRIESGNVVAFTVVLEHPDGTYSIGGSGTLSRLQMAGALLDAAVTRLKD